MPRPKNHTVSMDKYIFGFTAFGGMAPKPLVAGKCVVVWPWFPKRPKTTWPQKTLRDPSGIMLQGRK